VVEAAEAVAARPPEQVVVVVAVAAGPEAALLRARVPAAADSTSREALRALLLRA
jgi:hypothetical protein